MKNSIICYKYLLTETPKNSPIKHGFQNVDLVSPISNSIGISRRSSVSSITSDNSSLFPIYGSPANLYHLQVLQKIYNYKFKEINISFIMTIVLNYLFYL